MSNFNPSPAFRDRKRNPSLHLGLYAGIIGPILFVSVFMLDGLLKPGYTNQPISYLEIGANGWIQSTNFFVLGLLLILFAFSFFQYMKPLIKRLPLFISTVLLFLVGLALINVAVFIPATPEEAQNVGHAILHSIGFETIFFSLPLASLIIGWNLRKTRAWRGFGWYSIIASFITVIPGVFVLFAFFAPSGGSQPSLFIGLINRCFVIEALGWYVVMGIRMLTLENPE